MPAQLPSPRVDRIVQGLRKLYDEVKDEAIREKALALIETEDDLKYRKNYEGLWRAK